MAEAGIDPVEIKLITKKAKAYKKGGLPPLKAYRKAIEDYLDELYEEKQSIERQIKGAR